ncbi:MAG: hypothetical protein IT258_13020 [Saprospiraceae bacterium]|nr:hypothetical protein [Saprospiraceae bacterium]
MKRWMPSFGFLLACGNLFCQKIAIENHTYQLVYPWIDFPLTVVVENIPCQSLHLTTDNGKIMRNGGNGCDWSYTAMWVGDAKVFIHQIKGRDTLLLGEKEIAVIHWPTQTATIGNRSSGKMKLGFLKAQKGLIINMALGIPKRDIDGTIHVTRFQTSIIRNGELIAFEKTQGNVFSDATQAALAKVLPGDKVVFDEIYATLPGMKVEEKLNTITLEIE